MISFFGLHLILGGKLDNERREDPFLFLVFTQFWGVNWTSKVVKIFFLVFTDILFSVETETGNRALPSSLSNSLHALDGSLLKSKTRSLKT